MIVLLELAQIASWESGAILLGTAAVVTAIYKGQSEVAGQVRGATKEIKHHAESVMVKVNGVPIQYLENWHHPAWCKDREGVMRYINPAYTRQFGVLPSQYVGKRDRDVWPENVANHFTKHDDEVVDRRIRIEFHEFVPSDAEKPELGGERWYVVKFPIFDEVGSVKYVGGYCEPRSYSDRAAGDTGEHKFTVGESEDEI